MKLKELMKQYKEHIQDKYDTKFLFAPRPNTGAEREDFLEQISEKPHNVLWGHPYFDGNKRAAFLALIIQQEVKLVEEDKVDYKDKKDLAYSVIDTLISMTNYHHMYYTIDLLPKEMSLKDIFDVCDLLLAYDQGKDWDE
jgi:fido (protein-threonine AMPylation protein)